MKKDEYLARLKNHISSLTIDEQNEALQYYSDYFDEANNDEKVSEELGPPEKLAKVIIEKFANVPAKLFNTEQTINQNENGAMFFSFHGKEIKNVYLNFCMVQAAAIPGKDFTVETRGIEKDGITCVFSNGNLFISTEKKIGRRTFFSHDRKTRFYPRILLTIPENTAVEKFSLKISAGSFDAERIALSSAVSNLEIGLGNLSLKHIHNAQFIIKCILGNCKIEGTASGKTDIDCCLGKVQMNLQGNSADYSCDAKTALGVVNFNGEKKTGICKYFDSRKKENHFSVNCGIGNVAIHFK